jgi:DNA-directed RNA polymerase specialized sigma24 family protein
MKREMAVETTSLTFETAWADVGPRISQVLAGKRIAADICEDIAQETALRVFVHWGEIDHDRPLFPLAITIALNLYRDRVRKSRKETLTEIPERAATEDVERTTLARFELARVGKGVRLPFRRAEARVDAGPRAVE